MQQEIKNLKIVTDLLKEKRVLFWIAHGALLGYIRDQKLIPWSKDIDLQTHAENREKVQELYPFFKKLGFKITFKLKSMVLQKDGYAYSIGFWTKRDDEYINTGLALTKGTGGSNWLKSIFMYRIFFPIGSPIKEGPVRKWLYEKLFIFGVKYLGLYIRQYTYPSHLFRYLRNIDFFGVSLLAPYDSIGFLDYEYGENWRTPDEHYWQGAIGKERSVFDLPYQKGMEKYENRFELSDCSN